MTQTITRRRAKAIIVDRLADLGHAPDFLKEDAVEALLSRSERVPHALHAALAATLFLASTEDALHVGRDIVERAVPDGMTADAPPVARRSPRWVYVGGLTILACSGVALLLSRHAVSPRPPVLPEKSAIRPVSPAEPARLVPDSVAPAPPPVVPLPAPPPQIVAADPAGDLTRAVAADLAGDSAKAFRLYLGAAAAGLPEAQFGVAVKYDSGRGAPHSAPDAALYYAFAACSGHGMAAYNLGLLYQSGDGVPRNPAVAQAWFQAALRHGVHQTMPIQPGQIATGRTPEVPTPLYPSGGTVIRPVQDFVPLVWAAPADPAPVHYEIQLTASQGAAPHDVLTQSVDVSAARVPVGRKPGQYAWRVVAIGQRGSAATDWVQFSVGGLQ